MNWETIEDWKESGMYSFAPDVPFTIFVTSPESDEGFSIRRPEGYLGHGPYYTSNYLKTAFDICLDTQIVVVKKHQITKKRKKNENGQDLFDAKVGKYLAEDLDQKVELKEFEFWCVDFESGETVEKALDTCAEIYPQSDFHVIKPDPNLYKTILEDVRKGLFKIQRNTRVELEVIGWKKTPENHILFGVGDFIKYVKEHKIWDKNDMPFYLYSRKPDIDNSDEPTAILRPRVTFRYHEPYPEQKGPKAMLTVIYDLPVDVEDRSPQSAVKKAPTVGIGLLYRHKATENAHLCLLPSHQGTNWEYHFNFLIREETIRWYGAPQTLGEFLDYDLQVLDESGNTVPWWSQFTKSIKTNSNAPAHSIDYPKMDEKYRSRTEYAASGELVKYDNDGNWKVKRREPEILGSNKKE